MTLEQENALLSIRALLDHWAALPAATRVLQPHLLALLEECEPRLDMRSLHQLGQGFVLAVRVPAGDDPEEYCAAVEAFFDYPRLTVQPYEVPKFPMPDDRGYVEVGGYAEQYTYEVGKGW
jgi:hypothetical protein